MHSWYGDDAHPTGMTKLEIAATEPVPLKSFVGPWTRKERQLLLACGKCQRKLREDADAQGLAKFKKLVKKRAKHSDLGVQLIVIETKCLKVCPRAGVAVCTQAQVGAGRGSIVRSVADVDLLLAECAADPAVEMQRQIRSAGPV